MFIHVALAVHRYIYKAHSSRDCIIRAALEQQQDMAKKRIKSWGLRWCKFLQWLGVPWEWEHPSHPTMFKDRLVDRFLEEAYCQLALAVGPSTIFYRTHWAPLSLSSMDFALAPYWSLHVPA